MAMRWLFVPRVGTGSEPDDEYRPKYAATTGIDGWSGQPIDMSQFSVSLSGWWYLARFEGTTSALDTVQGNSDAYSLADLSMSESKAAELVSSTLAGSFNWVELHYRFFA